MKWFTSDASSFSRRFFSSTVSVSNFLMVSSFLKSELTTSNSDTNKWLLLSLFDEQLIESLGLRIVLGFQMQIVFFDILLIWWNIQSIDQLWTDIGIKIR